MTRSQEEASAICDPRTTVTPRQLELLALYASGYSYVEISSMKFWAYHTVRNDLLRAVERTRAKNVAHLCALCIEAGLIRKNGVGFKPIPPEGVIGE